MDGQEKIITLWLITLCVGAITFALRFSFVVWFGHKAIPPLLQRALRFVPASVFTAILIPELLYRGGALQLSLDNARLWAGAVAALVAWRTRSPLWTISVGMLTLVILQS